MNCTAVTVPVSGFTHVLMCNSLTSLKQTILPHLELFVSLYFQRLNGWMVHPIPLPCKEKVPLFNLAISWTSLHSSGFLLWVWPFSTCTIYGFSIQQSARAGNQLFSLWKASQFQEKAKAFEASVNPVGFGVTKGNACFSLTGFILLLLKTAFCLLASFQLSVWKTETTWDVNHLLQALKRVAIMNGVFENKCAHWKLSQFFFFSAWHWGWRGVKQNHTK